MFVQTKKLQYWKSDYKDMNGCQDACELDPGRGLFAVTDGAGTTLFPAIWARILARHFVDIPLMSDDPFEVEWWVRLAQEEYKVKIPHMEQLLDWSVRQKAQSQGSDSTLATVRISSVDPSSSSAHAELLVFGDSCVIIGNTVTCRIEKSFVLQDPADFGQAPICVPSTLKFFNRSFHRCSIESITLQPHHIVILATDAVSKWILSGGSRGPHHAEVWDAFLEVCRQSQEDWRRFIEDSRRDKGMVDDDSTALVLRFKEHGHGDGVPLGSTTTHEHPVARDDKAIDVIKERKEAFQNARQDENNELVAIYYGDGKDLRSLVDITDQEIRRAQEVADALKEVMRTFRQAQNTPGLAAKVEPVWRQYGHLLQQEKCADNIRETLQRNGVNLTLSGQQVPSPPASSPAEKMIQPLIGLPSQPGAALVELSRGVIGEQEKKDLEFNFLQALRDNHEDAILAAAEAIDAARPRYSDLLAFKQEEIKRIGEARTRREALEKLQRALQNRLVEEIAAAYDPRWINVQSLTTDEWKRVELACRLAKAYKDNDDEVILTTYQQVRDQNLFTFTRQDQEHIDAAQRRLHALVKFRVALDSGRLQQIANAYDSILNDYKRVTGSERQLLALAQEFVAACTADDDDAIVTTYEKIKDSLYRESIAFTEGERRRIEKAEMHVQTVLRARMKVVAKMKGAEITLETLRRVCSVKEPYIRYRISILQQQLNNETEADARQELELRILQLNAEIDQQQLPTFVLDDIIEDALIRRKIAEEKQQGVPLDDFDVDGQFPSFLEAFKKYTGSDYDVLLKSNRLTQGDVTEILRLFLRRELFHVHFQNQQKSIRPRFPLAAWQKPMQLDEWLDKQRRDAAVTYMQYSSDAYRRGLWLSEQLQQTK
jgi:hypothetical protein